MYVYASGPSGPFGYNTILTKNVRVNISDREITTHTHTHTHAIINVYTYCIYMRASRDHSNNRVYDVGLMSASIEGTMYIIYFYYYAFYLIYIAYVML